MGENKVYKKSEVRGEGKMSFCTQGYEISVYDALQKVVMRE